MKRQRGRSSRSNNKGGNSGGGGNRSMESNGPDVKVRGAPSTVYEKYIQLARDASSSDDRVKAENYLQHAEHYFRIMRTQEEQKQQRQQDNNRNDQRDQRQDQQRASGGNNNGGGNSQNNDQRGESKNDDAQQGRSNNNNSNNNNRQDDQPKAQTQNRGGGDQSQNNADNTRDASTDGAKETKPRRPRAKKPESGNGNPLEVVTPEESGELGAASKDEAPKRRGRPRKSDAESDGKSKKEAASA